MADQISGRVTYANGLPAAGVRMRVFDSDISGGDDDLTLQEGISAPDGSYTVIYDKARSVDLRSIEVSLGPIRFNKQIAEPFDLYLPYLLLSYTSYGRTRSQKTRLESTSPQIRLADPPPVVGQFVPSQHGFKFGNYFPGSPLPFTIPELPGVTSIPSFYGLCGGMSAAAADCFYAGKPIPAVRETPTKRTNLYNYLMRRQIDSFSPFGEPVLRFVKWANMVENTPLGTWHRSADEFAQLKSLFDAGMPVHPIGLVFSNPGEALWENHQVLAHGYIERSPSVVEIQIYDPNYPENDQVVIRADRMTLTGSDASGQQTSFTTLRCARVARVADLLGRPKEEIRPMRGMFLMPYEPVAVPGNV